MAPQVGHAPCSEPMIGAAPFIPRACSHGAAPSADEPTSASHRDRCGSSGSAVSSASYDRGDVVITILGDFYDPDLAGLCAEGGRTDADASDAHHSHAQAQRIGSTGSTKTVRFVGVD